MLWTGPPDGLSVDGWRVAATGVLMAVWWICESLPLAMTALVPLVLFPVLDAGTIDQVATPYANPLIFLFLGGFLIALAMQRWGLHRRIALSIIRAVGTNPSRIVAGFMGAAAFLSMWVSNTATAMMMLPIGLSIGRLAETSESGRTDSNVSPDSSSHGFASGLMLAIAYACSIGGLGTLIGTPPNALLAGYFDEAYGVQIGFAEWMLVGIPLVVIGLPVAYAVVTRVAMPERLEELAGGRALIASEMESLGPIRFPEKAVAVVFSLTAVLWMTRPLLADKIPGLSDAGIAMTGAIALFLIPAHWKAGTFVLDWATARDVPWGVLILFGGGLSLASAVERTGLASWIGSALGGLDAFPVVLLIATIALVVVLLTELTSNTATAAAFLPIMGSVAVGIGQHPLLLAVPAALAASCAFMLPVATPPNAIVYGSGLLTIPQMARTGLALNVAFVAIITAATYLLVAAVFGIDLGVVPPWAQ